jgi:hypothetical protein
LPFLLAIGPSRQACVSVLFASPWPPLHLPCR